MKRPLRLALVLIGLAVAGGAALARWAGSSAHRSAIGGARLQSRGDATTALRPAPGGAERANSGGERVFTSARGEPSVRAPAVMGSFYPAAPADLRAEVQSCLKRAELKPAPGELIALIVPHAGYSYSAPVAAYAYRLLEGRRYQTVAVIGSSHQVPFGGVALSGLDQWLTPLDRVSVNRTASQAIAKAYPKAKVLDAAHEPEHSIEVQLPFLQVTLGDFQLLPMLMVDSSRENCAGLARALADWASQHSALLIASTDMSHYPAYDDAVRVDKETLRAIETMDAERVAATTRKLMSQGVPRLSTCLCGEGPVKTVLMAARLLGADRVRVLKYANSGDAPIGQRDGVVGYCAVAIYRTKPRAKTAAQDHALTGEQQQRLLSIARKAIETYVRTGRRVEIEETLRLPSGQADQALLENGAAFVTLREHGRLRGCIGSLEAVQPLAETVRDRAIMAAVGDTRFAPVGPAELDQLEIEVSVLSPLRRVASADEIEIPKHGVLVVSGARSGVYLPQVAEETGWSRETLLSHLCREKAGLPADAWKRGAELYVFTVQAFSSPAPAGKSHAGD